MSKYRHKVENIAGFMLLSSIENVWGTYCIDSLSDETIKSYYNFRKNLEKDVALPSGDIDCFEIFAVYNKK